MGHSIGSARLGLSPVKSGNGIDPQVVVSKSSQVESVGGTGVNPGSSDYTVEKDQGNGGNDHGNNNGAGSDSNNNGNAGSDGASDGSNGGSGSGSGNSNGGNKGNSGSDKGVNGKPSSSSTLLATGDKTPLGAITALVTAAAGSMAAGVAAITRRKFNR